MLIKFVWLFRTSFKLGGLWRPISLSSFLSILSLSLGVGILIVAMSLVDGYVSSFKESLYSVVSHVSLYPQDQSKLASKVELTEFIEHFYSEEFHFALGTKKEALLAHKGKVAGVVLEGVSFSQSSFVIKYQDKITQGQLPNQKSTVPEVLLGKSLAKNFDLKLGEEFAVVVPQIGQMQEGFSRKVFTLKLVGTVDLGSYDANKRFVLASQGFVNKVALKPESFYSEVKVRLRSGDHAPSFKNKVLAQASNLYWVQTWKDKSGGLLEAIKIERLVIFFLVFILVVVAAFNVSTNLYLNLSKKTSEFSLLKSLGLPSQNLMWMFVLNGLYLGLIGTLFGVALAQVIMTFLNFILKQGWFIPPEVYKLTSIHLDLSLSSVLFIMLATLVMCVLASLAPALSSRRISIVNGLRAS